MASLNRSVRRFAIVGTSLIVRSENLIVRPRNPTWLRPIPHASSRAPDGSQPLTRCHGRLQQMKLKSLEKDTANVLRTRSVDRNPSV